MSSGWVELPLWLAAPARAVFADIQGDEPIPDLSLLAKGMDHPDAVVLGVFESDGTGGGRSVSRLADPVDMLLEIARFCRTKATRRREGCACRGQSGGPARHDGRGSASARGGCVVPAHHLRYAPAVGPASPCGSAGAERLFSHTSIVRCAVAACTVTTTAQPES